MSTSPKYSEIVQKSIGISKEQVSAAAAMSDDDEIVIAPIAAAVIVPAPAPVAAAAEIRKAAETRRLARLAQAELEAAEEEAAEMDRIAELEAAEVKKKSLARMQQLRAKLQVQSPAPVPVPVVKSKSASLAKAATRKEPEEEEFTPVERRQRIVKDQKWVTLNQCKFGLFCKKLGDDTHTSKYHHVPTEECKHNDEECPHGKWCKFVHPWMNPLFREVRTDDDDKECTITEVEAKMLSYCHKFTNPKSAAAASADDHESDWATDICPQSFGCTNKTCSATIHVAFNTCKKPDCSAGVECRFLHKADSKHIHRDSEGTVDAVNPALFEKRWQTTTTKGGIRACRI